MGEVRIACVGAGFVGLETSLSFVEAGYEVVAIDTDAEVVDAIESGRTPPRLASDDRIADAVESGRFRASTAVKDAAGADVYVVSIPTPVTDEGDPDLSAGRAAARSVGEVLAPRNLIVQQSTVYPGGCRDLFVPVIKARGFDVGDDIGLAYVPERYSPGDDESKTAPRVVGAVSERWRELTVDLYANITDSVVPVSSIKAAECTKQIENVQRDVNIALINEAHRAFVEFGVDTAEVLDAAGTKWNFHRYDPGIGVGGHCIPVDPYYFIHASREADCDLSVVPAARTVNESMPEYYCRKITNALEAFDIAPDDARAAILGATYKPGVRDTRNSPALEVGSELEANGIDVAVYDPMYEPEETIDGRKNGTDLASTVSGTDCVVVGTPHSSFVEAGIGVLAPDSGDRLLVDPYRLFDRSRVREHSLVPCPSRRGASEPRVVSDD